LAGWADILILPSTNVIIVITYYICNVCCNCWKGISVLVTANGSVQQEPTGRSRKSLAGKGNKEVLFVIMEVMSVSIVNKNNKIFRNIKQKINSQ
jgi:hypothetical protein